MSDDVKLLTREELEALPQRINGFGNLDLIDAQDRAAAAYVRLLATALDLVRQLADAQEDSARLDALEAEGGGEVSFVTSRGVFIGRSWREAIDKGRGDSPALIPVGGCQNISGTRGDKSGAVRNANLTSPNPSTTRSGREAKE